MVSRFHLSPLDKDDISNYINHRLHRAGAKRPIFDSGCAAALFNLTGGVPRLINLVCHQSLVAAYSIGAQTVSPKLVKQAATEILSESKKSSAKKLSLLGYIVGLALIAGLMIKLGPPELLDSVFPPETQLNISAERLDDLDGPDGQNSPGNNALDVVEIAAVPLSLIAKPLIPELLTAEPLIAESLAAEILIAAPNPEISIDPVLNISSEEPATPLNSNPFVGLLALWGAEAADVYSAEELAAAASQANLRSEKISSVDMAILEQINRPGIVWLSEDSGYLKSYVLQQLADGEIGLQGRQGKLSLTEEQFQQRWNGAYLYLWRPPAAYIAPLIADQNGAQNISNPEVVDWLQAQLATLDNNSDIIISGGRYTAAIAQQILGFQQQQDLVADGILGRATLMRLNQLSDNSIPLLREAD